VKIGLLHSLIRKEEKLLIGAFRNAGVEPIMMDDRKLIMDFKTAPDIDILVERSINHSRALHALRLFESAGVCCVNSHKVAQICGDKLLTTAALRDHGIAQPECRVAFTEESALEAIEELGYPVVLKPAVGSWGRLLSKINDRDAAETVLEHKTVLAVRRETGSRHPQLRGRRRLHRGNLPQFGPLDYQYGTRRAGQQLRSHARGCRNFAGRGKGGGRRHRRRRPVRK
jgi:RimK family alpha-L-glutamate ligase